QDESGAPPPRFTGADAATSASSARLAEELVGVVPVHEVVDPGLKIIGPAVAVIDVVRMFPDIAAEDWRRPVYERILAVRRLHHLELAVLHGQPAPARPELADPGLDESLLELFDAADVLDDLLLQPAGNRTAATR